MYVTDVVSPYVTPELANRFDKGDDLDVTDGAANLDNDDIEIFRIQASNSLFNLIGDVRYHLDCFAEVVAASLFSDH